MRRDVRRFSGRRLGATFARAGPAACNSFASQGGSELGGFKLCLQKRAFSLAACVDHPALWPPPSCMSSAATSGPRAAGSGSSQRFTTTAWRIFDVTSCFDWLRPAPCCAWCACLPSECSSAGERRLTLAPAVLMAHRARRGARVCAPSPPLWQGHMPTSTRLHSLLSARPLCFPSASSGETRSRCAKNANLPSLAAARRT